MQRAVVGNWGVVAHLVERRPRDPMDSMTRGSNPYPTPTLSCTYPTLHLPYPAPTLHLPYTYPTLPYTYPTLHAPTPATPTAYTYPTLHGLPYTYPTLPYITLPYPT